MNDAMMTLLFLALGGGIGSVLRAVLSASVAARSHPAFGTFIVNISGSFLIGCAWSAMVASQDAMLSNLYFQFLAIGVLGGYTTVSSFALQSLELWRQNHQSAVILNTLGSVVSCPFAAIFGYLLLAQIFNGGAL